MGQAVRYMYMHICISIFTYMYIGTYMEQNGTQMEHKETYMEDNWKIHVTYMEHQLAVRTYMEHQSTNQTYIEHKWDIN